MDDTVDDLRGHGRLGRLADEEAARRTEGEDGSSSADDFGLRRRFVRPHVSARATELGSDTVSERRWEPAISEYDEREKATDGYDEGRIQPGAASRKILDPEDPDRHQPPVMKKKKKKKGLAIKHSQGKPDKVGKKRLREKFTKENLRSFLFGHIVPDTHQDSYVIYLMRDFAVYLIFVIITSVAIFGSDGHADNYFASVLADIVVKSKFVNNYNIKMTFKDITHRREMWTFINNILMELLYESSTIDADQQRRQFVEDGYKVILENVLFGAPQIRQVRVKGGTCESAPLFKGVFDNCADYYSQSVEDKSPFGMKKSAWTYKPPTVDHVPVAGVFGTYGGGGFTVSLGQTRDSAQSLIQELQRQRWVRFGTRAVFVDINLLNPNTQLFCAAKLLFEMPPTGGTVPHAYFTTVKLIWYSGPWGFFLLSCHITFIAFIIFFTYGEILRIHRLKSAYFSWWNALEITILLCSYVAIALAIMTIISNRDFLYRNFHLIHSSHHVSFDRVVLMQTRYRITVTALAFFVWVKILKFSMLNKTVYWMLTAFAKVRSELIAATVLMAMLMFGFALLGLSTVGHLFEQLSAVGTTVFTMFGLIGGGIHFYFSRKIREFAFRAWLLSYIIACIVIFVNIYVALIVHGFELAQNDVEDLSTRAQFGDVVRELFCKFLLCIRKRKLVEDIYGRQIEKQNIRLFLHLADILVRHGFDNREISLIFAEQRINYGKPIPIETMSVVYEEMTVRKQLFVETGGHGKISEQLEKISRNVEQVDQTVMSVMIKVDILTNKYLTDNVKT